MKDFFEIDFLNVGTSKSGDAICVRYCENGETRIHVIDGGFQDTGQIIVDHVEMHYGNPTFIDNVIVTHNDGDHTGGLEQVLKHFTIGTLWMNRPWEFAHELLPNFPTYNSIDRLTTKLKNEYENLWNLEEIAHNFHIPIKNAFQGDCIGNFIVMSPTKQRFLTLVLESDKTPDSHVSSVHSAFKSVKQKVVTMVKAMWGEEYFPNQDTSSENEMSIVQLASLCEKNILLTGDTGKQGLNEAANYASHFSGEFPHPHFFQVPHHGSRRNVSTDVLDRWLGPRMRQNSHIGNENFNAYISAAKNDKDHPRKAVIRAMIHRGRQVFTNETSTIRYCLHAPLRPSWGPIAPLDYPEDQEN